MRGAGQQTRGVWRRWRPRSRVCGTVLLGMLAFAAVAAPALAPNPPNQQFRDHLSAPPARVRVIDVDGPHLPFVHPIVLEDRVARRYAEDRSRRVPLAWFAGGTLVNTTDPTAGPLLLLGADQLGRDVLARLLHGARASLGVALLAALVAVFVGGLIGTMAGAAGGLADEALMRVADFVIVLPAIYVVLALRAVTPLVLSPAAIFALMTGVFAIVGWPPVARSVRAIVASERQRDYTLAAIAVGVGPVRLVRRHLLPATYGNLGVQATLLVPSFILAEATLSFVGLGFPQVTPSWGVMLQEASNVRALADFPWLLSPAAAIKRPRARRFPVAAQSGRRDAAVVLGVNLVARPEQRYAWMAARSHVATR